MLGELLPVTVTFRPSPRSRRRITWTRFTTWCRLHSGETASAALEAAQREYPKACELTVTEEAL